MNKPSACRKKLWQQRHPEQWKAIQLTANTRRRADPVLRERDREQHREYVRQVAAWCKALKETTPCFDCGKLDLPYLMDFDHLQGTKNRSPQACRSLVECKREITKCQVVCVRCHRLRTYMRRQRGNKTGSV